MVILYFVTCDISLYSDKYGTKTAKRQLSSAVILKLVKYVNLTTESISLVVAGAPRIPQFGFYTFCQRTSDEEFCFQTVV